MTKYDGLLRAAERMISDFPDDWENWCKKNGVVHADHGDKLDFYFEVTDGDK